MPTSALLPPFTDPFEDTRLERTEIARPLVSIIITNYNYGHYVIDTMRSVTRQSYANWECIVVDDVSTDDSRERIREYIARPDTPRQFTLIEPETNSGQMSAFMQGLERARGVFVVMLDSDDVLLEDFLDTHVRAHMGRQAVAFTSSNQYQIDGQGQLLSGDHADHMAKGRLTYISRPTFQRGYWIWGTSSSMMFRRDTLRLIMPKDRTFAICADYYMAHFANLVGNSLLIPTIHGCYRRHGSNNFGSHPVLGAINSVGDLSKHPPHELFRQTIINHVITHHDVFEPIFTPRGFLQFLFRVATLREFIDLVKKRPDIFTRPAWHYFREYVNFRWKRRGIDPRYLMTEMQPLEMPGQHRAD